jgi:phosphoribosyl 1,2-cyclic phosphate phosphodiesterase
MRTSALLHLPGNKQVLIDAGPDFREQALQHGISWLDAVLLTHSHYDHVAGIDDLRPLTEHGGTIPIYANQGTLGDLRKRFDYAFAQIADGSSRPSLELHLVEPYQPFMLAGQQFYPLDVQHGTWTITGYRTGGLAYLTDVSAIPAASRELLYDLDVLVLSALRYTPHPTHLTLQQALDVLADLQPRRAFFVHMNHALDHAPVNALLPEGVALAHDGLTIEIEGDDCASGD